MSPGAISAGLLQAVAALALAGAVGLDAGEARTIPIRVDGDGFTPRTIAVHADEPVVLVFTRTSAASCADAVVFTATGIRRELPLQQTVRVSLTAAAGQRIAFACPAGRFTGEVAGDGAPDAVPGQLAVPTQGVVAIQATATGFLPSVIALPLGKPTVLRFTRTAEKTCNTAVSIPGLGITALRDLPLNQAVDITVTPDHAGEFGFACPMEMIKGKLVVGETAAPTSAPHEHDHVAPR